MTKTASVLRLTALVPLLAGACETYAPEPVDLAAHAREFAARVPDAAAVRAWVDALRERLPAAAPYDPSDGIDVREAQLLALVFHPELRAARARAGVARAGHEHAGLWPDPVLGANVLHALESVPEPWVLASQLELTLPVSGRPGLERDLAGTQLALAMTEARASESRVLAEVEERFAEWSAATERVRLEEQLIARLRELEETATRLERAHEITALEARPFTLERLAREGDLVRERAAARAAELGLKQALGLAPAAVVTFRPALAVALRGGEDEGARAARAAAGPLVAVRAQEHEVAERELALAVREQWPDLRLGPLAEREDGEARAGLGWSLPLPLWNRNRRAIAEARARRALAAEQLRGAVEVTLQELARAEARLAAAREERAFLERELLPLVERQLDDGRRLLELGRLDTLLLLDGGVRAHDAQARILDAALAEARAAAAVNAFAWPEPSLAGSEEQNEEETPR